MPKPTLADLTALNAIATHRSFRKAADELGLSPSTLSHMMRTLEENMGVRLLNRTTRSVSPTTVATQLLARIQPLLHELESAIAEVDEFRGRPSGTLRINAAEPAARLLLHRTLPTFLSTYPGMSVDLVTEGKFVDIVAEGFDAGVRLGESVPRDMIAVRFGGDVRFLAVASPRYLETHGAPQTPDDLSKHSCIQMRMPSGKLYRWEFEKHGQEVAVDVPGSLRLDHIELMTEAAANGIGIAYVPDRSARPYIERGELAPVLEDWCPAIPGLFLYYPGRRQMPPSLKAFIEVLKETLPNT